MLSIEEMGVTLKPGETHRPGDLKYGRFNATKGFVQVTQNVKNLLSWANSVNNKQAFFSQYIQLFVSRFGGKERFDLIRPQINGDLKDRPKNPLQALFQDNLRRKQVRDLTYEAFGKYFIIDPTSMTNLEIRMSSIAPPSEEVERGWTKASVDFHKDAKHINEFSDGVQAFTGLVMAVISGEEKIMLIDEPEAFLHPSLANLLGNKLSTIMSNRSGSLFVATHSPFFIMGCLQAGKKLNIVRLTYDESTHSTARLLSSIKVIELFKNPLLRSTGVIQALFHSTVVIGEADSDRAFYNEINERLLAQTEPEGLPRTLFLNAQNKQTVWTIMKPLREMGIPAVGIVDIDFVKDGGREFTKALLAAKVPTALHESLQGVRRDVKHAFESSGKDMKRDGGVSILSGGEKILANKLISDLSEYGIFIVPNGELESWLSHLKCNGHGSHWLQQVFNEMGEDPLSDKYVQPTEGDVWGFIKSMHSWVYNVDRKGV